MIAFIVAIALKIALFGICYWLIRKNKNLSIIDGFWAPSFLPEVVVAYGFYGLHGGNSIYLLMMSLWILRLGLYLKGRLSAIKSDSRYEKFSQDWAETEFNTMALKKVVIPQAVISLAMGMCSYCALFFSQNYPGDYFVITAFTVFIFGFSIEAVADGQLSQFKRRGRSETYTGGFWRFVRYPNYLGEIMVWTGFAIFALGKPYGFLGVISPIMIGYFLLKVTGIPYLEKRRASRESYPNPRPKYFILPYIY